MYVYIDNGIVESICNEEEELLKELNFIESEIARCRCKKCTKYKLLVIDSTTVMRQLREIDKILDSKNY